MDKSRIREEKTRCERGRINNINDFLKEKSKELGKADFIIYKHNAVVIGRIDRQNSMPAVSKEYLKEMRIFNEAAELHIWSYNGNFYYRLRRDGEGEKANVYEEEHIIWGERVEERENGTLLKEKRGTDIELPYKISTDDLPIKYKVRNYFDYDESGLIRFYDARLLYFMKENGEVLGEEG